MNSHCRTASPKPYWFLGKLIQFGWLGIGFIGMVRGFVVGQFIDSKALY